MEPKSDKHRKILLAIIAFLFAVTIFSHAGSFVEGFINGFNDALG